MGRGRVRVTPGGVVSPSERDPWLPSEKGRRSSSPAYARPLAQAPFYFKSSGRVFFFISGLRFHARILLPHAVIRAQLRAAAQPGARGQHLLAKPVSGACSSAGAQVTGLCKPGSLLCAPVSAILRTGLGLGLGVLGSLGLKRRELHWNLRSELRALRPWLWGPSAGLCPSSRLCSPHRVALAGFSVSAT